ncbi:hypothetical protein DSO57_1014750, partial [Entomophthora muscae]
KPFDKKENLKAIDWDSCQYEIIHFKDHQDTTTPQDCKIVACHPEIFKEALPGLPPEKHIVMVHMFGGLQAVLMLAK